MGYPIRNLPQSLCALLLTLVVLGCGEDGDDTGKGDAGSDGEPDEKVAAQPPSRVLTADWVNGSLSILDADMLRAGAATRDEVLLSEIDLSEFVPGPIEVAVTPDGATAVVTVSAGFFAGIAGTVILGADIPSGPGHVLKVDLGTGTVLEQFDSLAGPMGVTLSPRGDKAFVADFSGSGVTVLDVDSFAVDELIETGGGPERIQFDDSGSVGVVNVAASGELTSFPLAGPTRPPSTPVGAGGDTSGVAFFPGTKFVLAVQSGNPLVSAVGGYSIFDVEDPSDPMLLETIEFGTDANCYAAAAWPSGDSVVIPVSRAGRLSLVHVSWDGSASHQREVDVAEIGTDRIGAFSLSVDDATGTAVAALPGDSVLMIIDLEAGTSVSIPWLQEAGPSYATFF